MQTMMIGIPSWSNRIYRARKTYCCDNCGGTIPSGVKYCRHVVRLGLRKFRDPLRNIHVHLDCTAPWYQPDNQTHRLRNLGRLPLSIVPLADVIAAQTAPLLSVSSPALGTLLWQPPPNVAVKLLGSTFGNAAEAEMETVLGIILTALTISIGNKRRAMKVNNLITQLVSEIA